MKKLLFILFLTVVAYPQQYGILIKSDSLKNGIPSTEPSGADTTWVYNLGGSYRWVYIAYTDTGSIYADSVYVYTSAGADTTRWVRTPVYDPVDDVTTSVITNPNDTRLYLIYVPRPSWVKLVLANSGGGIIAGRSGYFVLRALNENY